LALNKRVVKKKRSKKERCFFGVMSLGISKKRAEVNSKFNFIDITGYWDFVELLKS
jgi:hypothetical protein